MYNISVFAYNEVSQDDDMLMFPVTDLPCRPPSTLIYDGTLDFYSAPKYRRGYEGKIHTFTQIDCNLTYLTE